MCSFSRKSTIFDSTISTFRHNTDEASDKKNNVEQDNSYCSN